MGTPIRAKVHHHQLVSSILDGLVQSAQACEFGHFGSASLLMIVDQPDQLALVGTSHAVHNLFILEENEGGQGSDAIVPSAFPVDLNVGLQKDNIATTTGIARVKHRVVP